MYVDRTHSIPSSGKYTVYTQKAGQYWMSIKWCSIATTLKNALLMKASLSKLRSKWRVAMYVQWAVASYGGTL